VLSAAVLLTACSGHVDPTEAKKTLSDAIENNSELVIPRSVTSALHRSGDTRITAPAEKRRFRIDARDIDAKEFFTSLVGQSRYSFVVHPDVSGTITLSLRNVTLGDVLNAVADTYGYDIQRRGGIIYVYPAGVRSETFEVNYLLLARQGNSSINVTTSGVSDDSDDSDSSSSSSSSSGSDSNSSGTDITTTSENDLWKSLEAALKGLVGTGEGRSVIMNPQAGLVTVTAMPKELKTVREFLSKTQEALRRQVIIEAKILEVTLNDGFQSGIDWENLKWRGVNDPERGVFAGTSTGVENGSYKYYTTNSTYGVTDDIIGLIGGGVGIRITDGSFATAIQLLKTQGDVTTLSNPRVTALNNQKAVIKVGTDRKYVSDISSSSNSDSSSTSLSPSISFETYFSGVALDVLPQIDADGHVLMHIHPSVIKVDDDPRVINLAGFGGTSSEPMTLPMAKSDVRETDTIVDANSGEIIVLGGLMETSEIDRQSRIPGLGDIPGLGEVFKNRQKVGQKRELVIMLKPVVVRENTWKDELQRASDLLDDWYPSKDSKKKGK
jgi:MSHA biogenesis protein MshL